MFDFAAIVGQLRSVLGLADRGRRPSRRAGTRARTVSRKQRLLAVEQLEGRLLACASDVACCGAGHMIHPDHAVMQAEHDAALNLVRVEDVTHVAVREGQWSDPGTWQDGRIPDAGSHVLIPRETTVVLDFVNPITLATIRVDGTFRFDSTHDTGLSVDSLVISQTGTLQIGTADNPVAAGVEARILIADRGPIDTHWDPMLLSRGLISHGTVSMHGLQTTSFGALAGPAWKGDTELVLSETPLNWKVGDRLILTGTNAQQNQDEELELLAVTNNHLTVRPLLYNHAPPAEGLAVHVANVSRNVVIASQNPQEASRRGHVMFMHSPKADIHYVGFYGLGRTEKRTPAEDPELDEMGQLIPGTGVNPRGRYPVHFHRTGVCPDVAPAVVQGSAVVDSPGWGYVNHSGNVLLEDNVSFNVVGAGFVTEAGDEIGTMRHNIAIRSQGSMDTLESRQDIQDFGHQGYGFWFQGPGVRVGDNVAVGHQHAGFLYFTRGLKQGELGTTTYLAANLEHPRWAWHTATIDVGSVPIREFTDNTTYASRIGLQISSHLMDAHHQGRSIIDGLVVWSTRGTGVFLQSSRQITLRNLRLLGNLDEPSGPGALTSNSAPGGFIPYDNPPSGVGIARDSLTRDLTHDNLDVQGWAIGVAVPEHGQNIIRGGKFNNLVSLEVPTAMSRGRLVRIVGKVQFGNLTDRSLAGRKQFDVFLRRNVSPTEQDISLLFERDVIRLDTKTYKGKQLYYAEQAADFVPFKLDQAAWYVPPELIGKTNQQLWDEYGLAIGGVIAPAGAISNPRTGGLIGKPVSYRPPVKLLSQKYTAQLKGYRLVYGVAGSRRVVAPTLVNLHQGWNLITRRVHGYPQTFFVFGDVTAPTFQLDFMLEDMMMINPQDLEKGFRVTGMVFDHSIGAIPFQRDFTNLDSLPLRTRANGSQFVVLQFEIKDRAGNSRRISLELTVSPYFPLQRELARRWLPPRNLPQTLLSLL